MTQALGSREPTILDQEKFDTAVQTAQQRARERYGVTLSPVQAKSILMGQPFKTTVKIPTLARLDQDFKNKIAESGVTGLWNNEPTLPAREAEAKWTGQYRGPGAAFAVPTLEREAQEATQTGITTMRPLTAEALGVELGTYVVNGRIVDGPALSHKANEIIARGTALGISITRPEANRLAQGQTVAGKLVPTVSGRGVAVEEQRVDLARDLQTKQLTFEERRLTLTETVAAKEMSVADRDVLIREKRLALDKLVATKRMTLEQAQLELDEWVKKGQLRLASRETVIREKQQALDAEVAKGRLTLDQARLALEDWVSKGELVLKARETSVREKAQMLADYVDRGRLTVEEARLALDDWISKGELVLKGRQIVVQEMTQRLENDKLYGYELANGTRVYGTLEMEYILRDREITNSAANRTWNTMMQEGGTFVDPVTGEETRIIGVNATADRRQAVENAQKYGGWLSVPDGRGGYVPLYVTGDRENDNQQKALDRKLQKYGIDETARRQILDQNYNLGLKYGMYVADPNVPEGRRWVKGSLQEGWDMAVKAQEYRITELELQASLAEHSDHLKYVHEKLLTNYRGDLAKSEAETDRLWRSVEGVLTRQHEQILQDQRLTAAEKLAKIEDTQQTWASVIGSMGRIGNTAVQAWLWGKLATDGANITGNLAQLGTKAYWTSLGADDATATALADTYTGSAAAGAGAAGAAGAGAPGAAGAAGAGDLGAATTPAAGAQDGGILEDLGIYAPSDATFAGVAVTAYVTAAWQGYKGYKSDLYGKLNKQSNIEDWNTRYGEWWDTLPYDVQIRVADEIRKKKAGRFADDGSLQGLDYGDKAFTKGEGPGEFTNMLDWLYLYASGNERGDIDRITRTPRRDRVGMDPDDTVLRGLSSSPADLIHSYWDLYDRDVFKEGASNLSVADVRVVTSAWKTLPGAARSRQWNQAQPTTSPADVGMMLQDLADFASDSGILSKRALQQVYADLAPALSKRRADDLTNEEAQSIQLVWDQVHGLGSRTPEGELVGGYSLQQILDALRDPSRMTSEARAILKPGEYRHVTGETSSLFADAVTASEGRASADDIRVIADDLPEAQKRRFLYVLATAGDFTQFDVKDIFGLVAGSDQVTHPTAYQRFQRLVESGAFRYNSDLGA